MRYAWDLSNAYLRDPLTRAAAAPLLGYLRRWDRRTSGRVHRFIANSGHVRERIRRCYGRAADVAHPPVETDRFCVSAQTKDYFLIVSALVPYKRIDIAVDAFNRLGLPLRVVGDGPERKRLERRARPNVSFLGWQPEDRLPDLYARALAFVLPGVEDFGIAPVEAQAAGRPVIALRAGGALETVLEGRTGVFFWPQTPEALVEAVLGFDPSDFRSEVLRAHARGFDRSVFERRMETLIGETWETHRQTQKENETPRAF
jgi:glycosyltransferase involved in cell wall biosynthesis